MPLCLSVCFQEELVGMKQRIRVVVFENEKLHRELKCKAVEDTLKDYTILDATVICCHPASWDSEWVCWCGWAGLTALSLLQMDGPEPMGRTPKADRAQHGQQAAAAVAQQLDTNKWQNELVCERSSSVPDTFKPVFLTSLFIPVVLRCTFLIFLARSYFVLFF